MSSKLSEDLRRRYGERLGMGQLQKVLHYPSAAATKRAVRNGYFPVPIHHEESTTASYVSTKDVVGLIIKYREPDKEDIAMKL